MTIVIEHRSSSPRFAFANTAARAVVRCVKALANAVSAEVDRRRTMALLSLSDGMLADIGVSRSEVYGAVVSTTGEKPSERLAILRTQHRLAERDQTREARRSLD